MSHYKISEEIYSDENFNKKIIFIFDGLDESKWNKNIFQNSQIGEKFPNAKIIITCRDEFLKIKEIFKI